MNIVRIMCILLLTPLAGLAQHHGNGGSSLNGELRVETGASWDHVNHFRLDGWVKKKKWDVVRLGTIYEDGDHSEKGLYIGAGRRFSRGERAELRINGLMFQADHDDGQTDLKPMLNAEGSASLSPVAPNWRAKADLYLSKGEIDIERLELKRALAQIFSLDLGLVAKGNHEKGWRARLYVGGSLVVPRGEIDTRYVFVDRSLRVGYRMDIR